MSKEGMVIIRWRVAWAGLEVENCMMWGSSLDPSIHNGSQIPLGPAAFGHVIAGEIQFFSRSTLIMTVMLCRVNLSRRFHGSACTSRRTNTPYFYSRHITAFYGMFVLLPQLQPSRLTAGMEESVAPSEVVASPGELIYDDRSGKWVS